MSCLVLAGTRAGFQWEDEHNVMDLSVFHPARNCSGGGTDMLMRSNICKLDEGGNWRIFNPTSN